MRRPALHATVAALALAAASPATGADTAGDREPARARNAREATMEQALEQIAQARARHRRRRAHLRRTVWQRRLAHLPASWRQWAASTSQCESQQGRDPEMNAHGFRGRFQWVMSTWRAAGGRGDPGNLRQTSYAHEAVIAIGLARREGTHHWPVCG